MLPRDGLEALLVLLAASPASDEVKKARPTAGVYAGLQFAIPSRSGRDSAWFSWLVVSVFLSWSRATPIPGANDKFAVSIIEKILICFLEKILICFLMNVSSTWRYFPNSNVTRVQGQDVNISTPRKHVCTGRLEAISARCLSIVLHQQLGLWR